MARQKLPEEERKKRRVESDKKYYESRVQTVDGEKINYSEYLETTGKKQMKLTLTTEEDRRVREYCDSQGIKPQDYIRGLIREDLRMDE